MRTYDFAPLWRSTIGFDRLFDLLHETQHRTEDNYPPYNIERLGEDRYQISLALAGFGPDEIAVTAEQNVLTVEGRKNDKDQHEYLYQDGEGYHFMNTESYEQFHVDADILGEAVYYLIPNTTVKLEFYENKVIGVVIPDTMDLTVVDTEPTVQKATASAVMKAAKLETGLMIQVPPFVNTGDRVRVDTSEARYVQRV